LHYYIQTCYYNLTKKTHITQTIDLMISFSAIKIDYRMFLIVTN